MAAQDDLGRRSIIERHLQSVLLAVITAVLLYMGQFVITSREESVRIATQLAVPEVTYTATEQAMLGALKTLVNQLRADLVAVGLIKGSA